MTTYTGTIHRGDTRWLVHIDQIDRTTQARNLAEAEPMARDLIAIMLDVPADSFEVSLEVVLPKQVQEELASAEHFREAASHAQSEAAAAVRSAARGLAAAGLTVRDIGRALGVSYQRAHQLTQ